MDMTNHRRMEDALRESEKTALVLLNATTAAAILIDSLGTILALNETAANNLGGTSEDFLDACVFDYFPQDSAGALKSAAEGVVQSGETAHLEHESDAHWFDVSFYPIFDSQGKVAKLAIYSRDITEKKKQFQKLETLGSLSGGMAHDFNNILMGIQGYTTLMLMNTAPDHPFAAYLEGTKELVASGARLTRQLLAFAKGGKEDIRPTDINDLVRKSVEMFGRTRKEITIRQRFQKNIWTVMVDHGQIEQVLLNLFVNSWQAMPRGGELRIETCNLSLKPSELIDREMKGLKAGKYVCISVADSGIGMPEEVVGRIFDPFFTTKETGTGLGLSYAYGTIRRCGGVITVQSREGFGSTFKVYLPALEKKLEVEAPSSRKELMKGKETVLVIDDEKFILEVTAEYLSLLGYTVLKAGNGQEALNVYAEEEKEIDLLILDMIMPGMSSEDFLSEVSKINPEVRVLLTSGYYFADRIDRLTTESSYEFIQKPYTIEALSQKVRDALSYHSGSELCPGDLNR